MKTRLKATGLLCFLVFIDFFIVIRFYPCASKVAFYIVWINAVKLLTILSSNKVKSDLRFKTWQEGAKLIMELFCIYFLSVLWIYLRSGEYVLSSDVLPYLIGCMVRLLLIEGVFHSEISRVRILGERERETK